MTYYHLPTDTERAPSRQGETKLLDGTLLRPPEGGWTPDLAAACGFTEVVDTPKPADTDTTTHDRTLSRDGDTVTVVWVERNKTQAELDAEAAAAEREETRFVLEQAIPTLRDWAATADGHTVTQGNAVATVQAITDNLAIFYARFADLLALQYGDGTG